MENKTWKTAIWNLSWEDIDSKNYNVEGNCHFSGEQGAFLNIPFGDLSRTRQLLETGKYTGNLEAPRFPFLYGITQDGTRLVLCDALSVGSGFSAPGSSYENIEAATVLSAKYDIDPTALITSLDFELEFLKEWIGVTYQSSNNRSIVLDLEKQHKSIPLSSSQDSKVELRYGMDYFQNTTSQLTIPYHCYLHVEYSSGLPLDEIWNNDVWNLRAMFAFFFGSYPSITWAKAYFEKSKLPVEIFRASSIARPNKKITNRCPISFSASTQSKLARIWRAWQNFNDDERLASQVLTSLLGDWEMPLDLFFIASTTMLESLARSHSKDCLTEDEFKIISKPIMKAADSSIKNRLQGLLGLLKHPSYSMLLDAIYEEGKPWSEHLIQDWKSFRTTQITLRHSGAHGIKNTNQHLLIYNHHQAQIVLAYIIFMIRLGFTEKEIESFENSYFMNASRWRIRQQYRKEVTVT